MNLSRPFIRRPVGTTLLTIGLAVAGMFAYSLLPVAPLPQFDFPTISVQASLPGASPETMSSSVAAPLERHLGTISDVTEMTSQSGQGTSRITLQFDINRDSNGAARDVQAAIGAARADLPTSLRSNPTYRKYNPADSPILLLGLTSETLTPGQMYDSAATVVQQKMLQVSGVGNIDIGGSSLPAVRVELEPGALIHYGIGLEDVRAALASANAHSPKGDISAGGERYQIYTNDQASHAADYRGLVIAYRNGAAVRLSDVAQVIDSVEDQRNLGLVDGKPAVMLIIFRQPGANIIETVDSIKKILPEIQASIPADIKVAVMGDHSQTIRASLRDAQRTLLIAVFLVIAVVFIFLRNARATLIPSVAVPISIIGTFGVMYLLDFSLDNLSLMALTIATGFVVDDAIVVLENISRHMEAGMNRLQASLLGAREVGFTVLSMSVSLIAVFLPLLLMGGLIGRIFQEFAVTLSVAIVISLVLSLTTTPMMCSRLLKIDHEKKPNRLSRIAENAFTRLTAGYDRSLSWALAHAWLVLLILIATIGLNVFLFFLVPGGFLPSSDNGMMMGQVQADQKISFQEMKVKLAEIERIIDADPAVANVAGFTGGQSVNAARVFVTLKPRGERSPMNEVQARLRPKLAKVAGAQLFLSGLDDIHIGGRQGFGTYQYTLEAPSSGELYDWTPKLVAALSKRPELADVTSDVQQGGQELDLAIDRSSLARYGLRPDMVDATLYDAFGQRQVSTIYNALNQYHVVMEYAPQYLQNPNILSQIWISTSGGAANGSGKTNAVAGTVTPVASSGTTSQSAFSVASDSARNAALNSIGTTGKGGASSGAAVSTGVETMVPFSSFARFEGGTVPLSVNHQGAFIAATISFNLAPGKSLSDAAAAFKDVQNQLNLPETIQGHFAGSAKTYQASLKNEPLLILGALLAVYLVLGILYESYVHPLTILSTLPSAGVGAFLALLICDSEFDLISGIGFILLIGIVKKNAIMMIDFALSQERLFGCAPREAIHQAALMRFRPILMTTFAALFGALPLAISGGEGSELRTPLGISIVGGLMVSQVLTLYTTPVVYLYLDRLRLWSARKWNALWDRKGRPALKARA